MQTGISQGLAQTAAIMQPSKSYYHCNGTDGVGGEKIGVWEGEKVEVKEVLLLSITLPKKNVHVRTHAHTPIPLSYCHCNTKL